MIYEGKCERKPERATALSSYGGPELMDSTLRQGPGLQHTRASQQRRCVAHAGARNQHTKGKHTGDTGSIKGHTSAHTRHTHTHTHTHCMNRLNEGSSAHTAHAPPRCAPARCYAAHAPVSRGCGAKLRNEILRKLAPLADHVGTSHAHRKYPVGSHAIAHTTIARASNLGPRPRFRERISN